jgi:RNA polymerase sigma-70 factor (ECF subfamily)
MPTWNVCVEAAIGFWGWQLQYDAVVRAMSALLPTLFNHLLLFLFSVFVAAQLIEELSDNDLIKKCHERSPDWNRFWKEFQRRFDEYIFFMILYELRRHWSSAVIYELKEAIQDLRQEVYEKLLKDDGKALKDFRGEHAESFRAYLRSIAINLTRNFSKKEKMQQMRMNDVIIESSAPKLFQINSLTNETEEHLDEEFVKDHMVTTLRAHYPSRNLDRDILIFKLYYFEGLSAKQIHKIMNDELTASGVESTVSRMKQLLEKIYFEN